MATKAKEPTALQRGNLSKAFEKDLTCGRLKDLIRIIREDKELDLQVRDNYLNIYYNGGNILRIAPRSFQFDKFYFYPGDKDNYPKSYIEYVSKQQYDKLPNKPKRLVPTFEDATKIIGGLKAKADNLLSSLPDNSSTFFTLAKTVMNDWFRKNPKAERSNQHDIALANRCFSDKNNLVVIDLEFAVSTNKEYNISKNAKGDKKKCRFDIIAVNQSGQIYVIELKENEAADNNSNSANVSVHKDDFDNTIGNDHKGEFITEMQNILRVKKLLNLISDNVAIDPAKKPVFAVAFSGENAKNFNDKYNARGICVVDVSKTSENYKINVLS